MLTKRIVAAAGLAWRRLGSTRGERLMEAATLACVALGLWLRARGFLFEPVSFWVDESAWAIYLVEQPLRELIIRPIGFMAISKAIALLFGPTEFALRTMPWLAGVAATLCTRPLARLLFSSHGARLLFVAIIALHPSAASFAKEFKPYSISLTLHLTLLFMTLSYVASPRAATLYWLLATSVIGTLFAQDLVFAYPGVFLVAGYSALASRRHLIALGVGGALVITLLLLQYFLIWSRIPSSDNQVWGDKYHTFFIQGSGTYGDWFFERYRGLVAFPGGHSKFWNAAWLSKEQWVPLRDVAAIVWLTLHVVGIVTLALRRRVREMLLLLLPLVLAWLFNLLGFWPFGLFRANLFTLVYLSGIAAMAFERRRETRARVLLELIPAAVLVVIPLIAFQKGFGPPKQGLTYTSSFKELVQFIASRMPRRSQAKQPIVIARECCFQWRYYTEFHPETSALGPQIARGFRPRCIADSSKVSEAVLKLTTSTIRPTWLVRGDQTDVPGLRDLTLKEKQDFGREVIIAYTLRAEP